MLFDYAFSAARFASIAHSVGVLSQLEKQSGFQSLMLQLTTKKDVNPDIRLAAGLRLKNLCGAWKYTEGPKCTFSEQDRKVIKENLLEAVIFQDSSKVR